MRVDQSAWREIDSEAKSALLQIVRVRFRAFEAKFGRLPEPEEPIFFDESQSRPMKADASELREQIERGAQEAKVEVDPVLSLLGFTTEKAKRVPRPAGDKSLRKSGHSQVLQLRRRESDTSSGWNRFIANERLHRRHRITRDELQAISTAAFLGEASTERDYLFILRMIRRHTTQ